MNIQDFLNREEDKACIDARDWAAGKTWPQIYATCERGDWMCWLFYRAADMSDERNHRALTLVKGFQANQVRRLMKHPASLAAVDTAIAYGRGEATREQMVAAAYAAAYAAYAAYAYGAAARKSSLKISADIFREHITIEMFTTISF